MSEDEADARRIFPPRLAEAARTAGLRVSAFEWTTGDLPGRDAASGTAVVGDPDVLQAFLNQFVAAQIGADGHLRAITAAPGDETTETVIYFPGYYLSGETEPT